MIVKPMTDEELEQAAQAILGEQPWPPIKPFTVPDYASAQSATVVSLWQAVHREPASFPVPAED